MQKENIQFCGSFSESSGLAPPPVCNFVIMLGFHGQHLLKGGPPSPGAQKSTPTSEFQEKAEHSCNS